MPRKKTEFQVVEEQVLYVMSLRTNSPNKEILIGEGDRKMLLAIEKSLKEYAWQKKLETAPPPAPARPRPSRAKAKPVVDRNLEFEEVADDSK